MCEHKPQWQVSESVAAVPTLWLLVVHAVQCTYDQLTVSTLLSTPHATIARVTTEVSACAVNFCG